MYAGAVFLVVLAGVDAAYSGDWSRTGVISKDFEDGLKPLVVALGFFHIGCAVVAGRSAASKNLNVPPAVLKVQPSSALLIICNQGLLCSLSLSEAPKTACKLDALLQVLAVGFLAMVEVLAAEPQPSQQ